jgi:hypothetical protein
VLRYVSVNYTLLGTAQYKTRKNHVNIWPIRRDGELAVPDYHGRTVFGVDDEAAAWHWRQCDDGFDVDSTGGALLRPAKATFIDHKSFHGWPTDAVPA